MYWKYMILSFNRILKWFHYIGTLKINEKNSLLIFAKRTSVTAGLPKLTSYSLYWTAMFFCGHKCYPSTLDSSSDRFSKGLRRIHQRPSCDGKYRVLVAIQVQSLACILLLYLSRCMQWGTVSMWSLAPQVVVMTTCGASSDSKVGTTFGF